MNKKIFVVGILFILTLVKFTGCVQNSEQQDSKEDIQLVSYFVETFEKNMSKIGTGFIHSEHSYWYRINGTVLNNIDRLISIRINMSFFDQNDTFLDSTFTHVYNVPPKQEKSFSLRVHLDFFNETEKVSFELTEA